MLRTLADGHPLRVSSRPDFEFGELRLRVVDLFAGCGGLTLGVAQAARACGWGIDVVLALDTDSSAISVYEVNFPKAHVRSQQVEDIFDGALGQKFSDAERTSAREIGVVHALVGGPPPPTHP